MTTVLTLPLDPTGRATTNDITGEQQTIGSGAVRAFAPNYGAFFASSLVVKDASTGVALTSNQYFTAVVLDLPTAKYGVAVNDTIVGMVIITDPAVTSNVVINYQALGAGYQTPVLGLVNDLLEYEPSSRPATWPSVLDKLSSTPASEALHDAGQAGLITFEYVVHALHRLTQATIMGDPVSQDAVKAYADAAEQTALGPLNAQLALLYQHEANTNNPHQVTALQLGAYTQAQQDAEIAAEHTLMQTGDTANTTTLTTHETNYQNPHQVTLAQLGMYSIATVNSNIAAAQTTVNSTITTNATTMNAHINNQNNPHHDSTTSLGTLTISQIQSAITNATNPSSSQATTDTNTLATHIANHSNPHQVTPAEIGTWTVAQLTALYNQLIGHITNGSNPHQVNVSQIAAWTAAQFNATLNAQEVSMSNYFTSNYNAMVAHINNPNNPHQVSAEYQLGGLGPWNLGQLESDLNNYQAAINASGYAFVESPTQYNDKNYSGAMSSNFGTNLVIYQAASNTAIGITGGGTTVTGSFTNFGPPGGGVVLGFFRCGNVITMIVENGSLDGTNFQSSLGDNVTFSNSWSYTWENGITAYGGTSPPVQTGASRGGYCHMSGFSGAGQPGYQYENGSPPATSSGGGGGGTNTPPTGNGGGTISNSCFVAGSKVLMADYTWKNIETVEAGDMLMSPTGPAKCLRLHHAVLGTERNLLTFAEDPQTQWVADHPLWARRDNKQWWWSGDAAYMRAEVETGLTQGLKDINSVYETDDVEYAYINGGFVKRQPKIVRNAHPDTKVYIPVLEGPPCIVNGYVAAAFFNEWEYDYTQLDWNVVHQAHRAGIEIAHAESLAIA